MPDKGGNTYANYLFSWWDLNGVRQQDASGVALTTFTFTLNTPSTATAHYVDPAVDADGDGIKDWNEWTYYGTLAYGPNDDTDGDGFFYSMETLRGLSPRAVDTMAQGGISRRRSVLTAVNAVFLPNPPAIGPNAATDIGSDTARLSVLLNPIGSPTTMFFQYGTSAAYGQQTASLAIGSGLQALTVEVVLTGLQPGTDYHFRVVATNGEGTSMSDDAIFHTLPLDYEHWRQIHGVGSALADDDGDGLVNLLEFAFGLDPLVPSNFGMLPGPDLVAGGLRLHYSPPTALANVTFGADYSTDLQIWTPIPDTGTLPAHEFLTPPGLLGAPRVFVRWAIRLTQ